MNGFSVLICVYHKDDPSFLEQALLSVFEQTLLPNEVVLMKDGPLTQALEGVISRFAKEHASLKTVALEKNIGLGPALNIGIQHCSHEIVARMDSDDICMPSRFERQYQFLEENPDVSMVGSWIEEFIDEATNVVGCRKVPEFPEEILAYAKLRCPFNHPTVMYRKSIVVAVGGYELFCTFDDYHLWGRILMGGYKTYNFQESHLYFRTSSDMYKRRGGMDKVLHEYKLQKYFLRIGLINLPMFFRNLLVRGLFRAAPSNLRGLFYNRR